MIPEIVAAFFLIMAITMHELGHMGILSFLLRRPVVVNVNLKRFCIEVGNDWDYDSLSNLQTATVYLGGVAAGFAPLIIACVVLPPLHYTILCMLYAAGCSSDIINTFKLFR